MDLNKIRYVPTNEEVNTMWNKVISRVSDRGIIKIISQLNVKALPSTIDHILPFNK